LNHRDVESLSQQHAKHISRSVHEVEAVNFFNLLAGPELLEMTDSLLPEHRDRLYPPTLALSMFMKQSLAADRSCQRAVDAWAGRRAAEGLSVRSIRGPNSRGARNLCRRRSTIVELRHGPR
jgi:hypothetical protein